MPFAFDSIPKILEVRNYSQEQIDQWVTQMRQDFQPEEGKIWKFFVTVGRKAERESNSRL